MIRTVLVCGDRYWTAYSAIMDELAWLNIESISAIRVIHGDCKGADKLAEKAAKELGFEFKAYPAKWSKYGNAAGPIRNQQMLDEGKPDLVVAFHDNIEESKGTKDMLQRAKDCGVEHVLVSSDGHKVIS